MLFAVKNPTDIITIVNQNYIFKVWGESKLAKMAYSGPLIPHFVSNDYVTAEIICSTAHACQEVLTWSRDTLGLHLFELHLKKASASLRCHGCVHWVRH